MRQTVLQCILIFSIFPWIVTSTGVCDEKPSLIQCVALKNQYILPLQNSCNPLKRNCETGDLVDPRVATCHVEFSGNVFHSLVDRDQVGYGYRCFPSIPNPDMYHRRNVGPSYGEPRCVPTNFDRYGTFVCGEHGTRCVCDAPPEKNEYGTQWLKHECRCQYFVNLCRIPKVCAHRGNCKMWGSELRCECPANNKHCRPGINQCRANPGLCVDEGKMCVELYDTNVGWMIGNEQKGDGFGCISTGTVDSLMKVTHYCDISKETFTRRGGVEPKNELDLCCYRMLTCAGGESIPKKGSIFSYRPCYCNVEFRKCLLAVAYDSKFKSKVEHMVEVVNSMAYCQIDDGVQCDPVRPWTCKKGDLINPKIAHCKIDCKTGPLLPIWARACAIRQCKPPLSSR
ncbi:hypothetical protein OS493_018956 [Desmophyllum pertusum]|uniref:Uncharacterized protein n=1 Tax=Desmophyllum pertusum TaxID=174260 RepID=A0A9X0CT22_9CNID|nr:hypothetical protein OS493_018956 [Desmophyllum pertusum]